MSRQQKLLEKLSRRPRDFTWKELVSLLAKLGWSVQSPGRTGSSRRRFVHPERGPIVLHQPHPNNVLKRYQIDQILDFLEKEGLL